jgi:hypothetical protein
MSREDAAMHRAAGPTTGAVYASASTACAAPSTSGFVSESALDAVVVELIRHASGFAKKRPDGAVDEDEDDDGVHDDVERDREARATLERIGERIGERAAERVSRGLAPCAAEQDAIMRACKEFWTFVHGKRVDKLKTNNKGVFVLHDDAFAAMRGVCGMGDEKLEARATSAYLALHSGVLRGGLRALGVDCVVTGDIVNTNLNPTNAGARPGLAPTRAPAPAVAFSVRVARPSG